eukprot:scaffold109297_cov23-Cyclotella_meneghiniana.AAC.1
MGMMNDDALLRSESDKWKGLHRLTFDVLVKVKCVLGVPTHQTKVCEHWDHNAQTTAAGPFQLLIMGMMNDDALLRLESDKWKGLHQLTFDVLVKVSPLIRPKYVSTGDHNAQTTAAGPF